ncbi:MAG: PQQ-binding-like beta-propeller repeat protein [bacterium]|nr:PQQ-binding-like beta-propeller repeat protein [bacterium]
MNTKRFFIILCFSLFAYMFIPLSSQGSDWPIFKGNIYFTGNNDEIIVKNNNLKWLFQANARIFNPIVSDSRVYFVDIKGYLYCLDEEFGKVIWKVNLKKISSQFKAFSRAAGKVKYPLIKGNILFLTDPIAIYAFDKRTGRVIWARTGMRMEQNKPTGLYGSRSRPMVDGIYSDPVIRGDRIFYGTRKMFMSRETRNGHEKWNNRNIKSFSGFPTFYDDMVFTQSMDYGSGRYVVHCLDSASGNEKWATRLEKPLKIFPPVVYKERVYIPTGKKIFCLDLKTGNRVWVKNYGEIITSNPSFTDRAVLFSIGNSDIAVIDPKTGNLRRRVKVAKRSAPRYVTIRDQLYIAYNEYTAMKGRKVPYGKVRAVNFSDNKNIWTYRTPFPGGVSQPASSGGILFLPAGNYLYAIGTEYYAKVIDGGSGHAVAPGDRKGEKETPVQPWKDDRNRNDSHKNDNQKKDNQKNNNQKKGIKTRKMKIAVTDDKNRPLPATVDITKRVKGKVVYSKKARVNKEGMIDVPEGDNVEILATSPKHVPKKVIINNNDKEKKIILDKIEQGKSIVVDNVNFEINKAYLKKNSLDILDKLIAIMKQNSKLKAEVRGHTDSTGNDAHNRKLSERRADSVVEYMIKNGISPERLNSVGFGETKPIASNKTKKGRAKNRRTEFFFAK